MPAQLHLGDAMPRQKMPERLHLLPVLARIWIQAGGPRPLVHDFPRPSRTEPPDDTIPVTGALSRHACDHPSGTLLLISPSLGSFTPYNDIMPSIAVLLLMNFSCLHHLVAYLYERRDD